MTTLENKKPIMYKKEKVWTGYQILLVAILAIFVLLCVVPFINVLAASLSTKSVILRGSVSLWNSPPLPIR